jgi:hypothetical protein
MKMISVIKYYLSSETKDPTYFPYGTVIECTPEIQATFTEQKEKVRKEMENKYE